MSATFLLYILDYNLDFRNIKITTQSAITVFALQANHHRIFHFLGIFSRISL